MGTNLRPLSLGEILDRTAQLYRSNFLLFAGIASVYAGVLLILSLAQIGIQEALRVRHLTSELTIATLVWALIMIPVVVIVGGLAVAANNRAVGWVNLGEPATIRAAYASVLPRIGRYLWLMIITTFMVGLPLWILGGAYIAFFAVYAVPKGLLAQNAASADPTGIAVLGLVTMSFALLMVPAMVYVVLMGLRYSLAVPACVIENLKAREAIRRSIALSKSSRGRIFLLILLVVAVQMGLALITQTFFVVAVFKYHGQLPVWIRILQQLVVFCTNTFVGPIYATGFTLFYYDQRVRKEGYDIEQMMRAAGLGGPAAFSAASVPLMPAPTEGPLS